MWTQSVYASSIIRDAGGGLAMLRSIVAFSLKFRMLVLTLAAGILAFGIIQLPKAAVDALPEFAPPYVEVQTEALGLSAHEVEQLITVPLEADLLNGVQDVTVIRSESVAGLSRIVMVFDTDTTLYEARSRVQEKLTQAHALPQVSRPPTMLQPLSSTSRVLMVSLASDTLTPIQRGVLARWTIRPRLMGIPGVANVAIWGQQERQLQVQVDPAQLKAKGVTLEQVVTSTGNAQIVSPLSFLEASTPGTGGFIETAQQRLQVIHVFDKLATAEEMAKIPVDGTTGKLRLGDVATIVEDHQPMIGDAIINGTGDGLMLVIEKFPNTNPHTVTAAVEKALEELKPGLSGMDVDASIFRSGNYVESATTNVTIAVVVGLALLGVGVLLWFLSWRTALVALGTTLVSLTASALVIQARGDTFNAISVAGFAMAATLIAYDAIRGAQNSRVSGTDQETFLASVGSTLSTLGYGLLMGIVAIVPVAVVDGTPGRFLSPAVASYLIAMGVAFVVALTLAPALEWVLISEQPPETGAAAKVGPTYSGQLAKVAGRPVALILLGALVAASVLGALFVPRNLVPELRDRDLVVSLRAAPGTSLPAMSQTVAAAIEKIKSVDGVESTAASVGRAVTGDQIVDVNSAEVWVRLADGARYDSALSAVTEAAAEAHGLTGEVSPYATRSLRGIGALEQGDTAAGNEMDVLTGSAHPLTVRIYGEDPVVMAAKADEALTLMGTVPGVKDARIIGSELQDSIEITVDMDRARQYGIKPGDVRRAEAILVQGIQVGSIFEGQKVFDVIVQGTPSTRHSLDAVKRLIIDAPAGGHVTLDQVADIRMVKVPTLIARDSVARRLDVVATVDGDLAGVAAAVEETLGQLQFPLEHHATVLTSSSKDTIDLPKVMGFGVAAALAILLFLQAALRSWRAAGIAYLSVVASLSGAVLGALLTAGTLGAWFGLLAVLGLAARSALQIREPRAEDDDSVGPLVIGQAATHHLARVVGSALGVALLVAPMLFMGGSAGMEVLQPFALVVLCGLLTATIVALMMPAFLATRASRAPVAAPGQVADMAAKDRAGGV
jgi:Cu/Ag efflux pump CusA